MSGTGGHDIDDSSFALLDTDLARWQELSDEHQRALNAMMRGERGARDRVIALSDELRRMGAVYRLRAAASNV